jgi:K+-sensing histidine kinase KdpD
MEESLQARIDELSTLLETSQVVVSSLDPEIVLNRILEQVERLLGINKSTIVALDEASGSFQSKVHRGLSSEYTEGLVFDPAESSSVTMRALQTGKPIIIQDVESDPGYAHLQTRAKAEGYRAFAAIPLQTMHAPPTALVLYSTEPDVFSENDIDLLLSFANQAAMAIENAELYSRSDAQLQKQTSRLEALIQSLEVGLVLENLAGEILYINRMIREFTLLPDSEILGNQVEKLYTSILERAVDKESAFEKVKTALTGESEEEVTFSLNTETGRRIFRLSGFTVRGPSGLLVGRGQFLRDVTREHELDRMKSGLISTVSHELQTPLASIKGFATTLLAKDVKWEQESQREFLEIISKEADRMSELVNNLLDVSRIEAGSLTLQKIYCSLDEIANKAISQASPNPGDRIQLEIAPDMPQVLIDPFRVEVVIRNLIENAVKYSENDLPIALKAERENGYVIVKVIDQGPGIPEENHRSIFSSFYRLDNGLSRKTPGFGLGLSICRGFVRAHGGEIWVEPRDVGACIAFSLPVED